MNPRPLQARNHRAALGVALLASLTLLAGLGCYSKVVGGKGIGADSTELRDNHEYGSKDPLGRVITRDKR